ncbi:MAG: hypothetical protein WAT39_03910 [Planctomycetota bacterium]
MTASGPARDRVERRRPGWQVLLVLVAFVGAIGGVIWFGVS